MKVLFTGGGTAGHINPALAAAGYLLQKEPDAEILYVGNKGGMEERLVHKAGFENIAYYATQDPDFFKIGGNVHAPFGTILGFIVLWALGI